MRLTRDPTLPHCGDDVAGALQRRADASIKPTKPQEPCDLGLFSDNAAQIDLVDLARRTDHNG